MTTVKKSPQALLLIGLLATGAQLHAQSGIYVSSNNNVGIGTISPQAALQINSCSSGIPTASNMFIVGTTDTIANGGLKISRAGASQNQLDQYAQINCSSGACNIISRGGTGSNGVFNFLSYDGTTLTSNIYINASGNVGIGTASPVAKLDVIDPTANDVILRIKSSIGGAGAQNAILYLRPTGPKQAQIAVPATSDLVLGESSSDPGAITSPHVTIQNTTGNVGIGTTSPGAKLDVVDPVNDAILRVKSASYGAQNAILYLRPTGPKQGQIAVVATCDLVLGESSSEPGAITSPHLTIQHTTGNVGIGTTSPGYPLDVAGQVRASAFIAPSQTYADFVFKPGYKLEPLSDVEASIQKDGHLPGIPSEAEAKAQGIDLASMQVKLLQKIEELTLHQIDEEKHQIDQEKKLSAQESQLSDQQNQLKEQARRIKDLEKENAELRERVAK